MSEKRGYTKGLDNVRMALTTSKQNFDLWSRLAADLGMNKSQFLNMACTIGAKSIQRQISPEEFITPDLLKVFNDAGFILPEKIESEEKNASSG